LRRLVPDLRVRVVNVVDLMRLFPAAYHPHGMTSAEFVDLFTADKPVVFAFHGYQRVIHEIVHGHPDVDRIHVRGFNEQGTTTTPFQMVVLNAMSRFHLAAEAIRRVPRMADRAPALIAECEARITESQVMDQEPYRSARRVFWIVDNGSSHRGDWAAEELRARHPRIVVVHTPVHASWLNQIEQYFSILQRKVLTPNDLSSTTELEARIAAFGQRYSSLGKPFAWMFTRQELERRLRDPVLEVDPMPLTVAA
jgi:hypothetical protein